MTRIKGHNSYFLKGKKWKLPRKKKKAFIKRKGSADYLGCRILGEVLSEIKL